MRSSARTSTSFGLKSSQGVANIIRMKFTAYERSLRGYMYGWPTEYLYAIATSVGILAISRIAEMSRWCASCRLIESRIERRQRADQAGHAPPSDARRAGIRA